MRARRIVPDTAAPRRRVGRSAGSLNLESALVVALLVLVAAFTLFSLGDAIACLYEREAHMANRIGFWAAMPAVTVESVEGAADGSVTWDVGDTDGDDTFTLLRMRPGDGADPEDHSTWTDLGTYTAADRPVEGLDIRDGDYVVVAVDVERCGYGLIAPRWPDGGGDPPDPTDPQVDPSIGPGWYAGTFEVGDGTTHSDPYITYIAAFDEDGVQLWDIPTEAGGNAMLAYSGLAVSDDNLFVLMRPEIDWAGGPGALEFVGDGGTAGIYAYPNWRTADGPGEAELVIPGGISGLTLTANDGTIYTSKDPFPGFSASRDGRRLLLITSPDGSTPYATEFSVADGRFEVVELPSWPYGGGVTSYGLDGGAYALCQEDEYSDAMLYRLDDGTATPVWPGSGIPASPAGQCYELSGVGPDGTAYLLDGDGFILAVSPAGTATEMSPNYSYATQIGFDSVGLPVETYYSGNQWAGNSLRYISADGNGTVLQDPLADIESDPRPVQDIFPNEFVGRMGNADIQGAPPTPPPPPTGSGDWTYEILVNGQVAYAQRFDPADDDSVRLNAVISTDEDLARYGRPEEGLLGVLPILRATTHRTLNDTGDANSDYAEINSPGRVPANASSMATPWSNYYDIHAPSAGLSYWMGLEPTGQTPTSSWAGLHRPLSGYWARSIEHANAHVTAIGRDGSELAKSLCISVVPKYQTALEERGGAGASATYRATGGLGIEAGGELNPYRVMNVVYPMLLLPSGTGWQVPDEMGGVSMADMSLQVAGLSWDDGAGSIPDSVLTYFNTDASYPTVAEGSRGLLVMDTNRDGTYDHANGDTVLSWATRSKRSTIEVRVTGGTVYPVTWTPLPVPEISVVWPIQEGEYAYMGDYDGGILIRDDYIPVAGISEAVIDWDPVFDKGTHGVPHASGGACPYDDPYCEGAGEGWTHYPSWLKYEAGPGAGEWHKHEFDYDALTIREYIDGARLDIVPLPVGVSAVAWEARTGVVVEPIGGWGSDTESRDAAFAAAFAAAAPSTVSFTPSEWAWERSPDGQFDWASNWWVRYRTESGQWSEWGNAGISISL